MATAWPPGTYNRPRTGSEPISAAALGGSGGQGRAHVESLVGEGDRRLRQFGEGARAEPVHRLVQKAECAGHRSGPATAHGNRLEAVRGKRLRGERERQRTGAVERHRWSTWLDDDEERIAADTGRLRLDDVEHQRSGHRRVDRVPTVAQDLHRGCGGARIRRRRRRCHIRR